MTNGCLAFQHRHATGYVGQLVADISRTVKVVLESLDRFGLANKRQLLLQREAME